MFRGFLTAVLLALLLVVIGLQPALAADPSTSPQPAGSPFLIDPLDPRAGEGASTTGAPFLALVFVIGLGATVVVSTVLYTRVTRRS